MLPASYCHGQSKRLRTSAVISVAIGSGYTDEIIGPRGGERLRQQIGFVQMLSVMPVPVK